MAHRQIEQIIDRPISANQSIVVYFHCGKCLDIRPEGISPQEWGSLEVGYTKLGIQVWCKRHKCNVVHIDFQGYQLPGNMKVAIEGGLEP